MGKFINFSFFKTDGINKHISNGGRTFGNCVLCGNFGLLEVHHELTRSRGGKNGKTVNLCRNCHDWINNHPELASHYGLYIRGYKING